MRCWASGAPGDGSSGRCPAAPAFAAGAPPRIVYAMVAVLAGATAIALLVVALTLGGPVPSGEAAAATTQSALIRGFYDAVNNVLVGGDPDALDSFVAPNVVVHAPEGEISGRAALAEEIAALGGASPGLQLHLSDLIVAGDQAAATVERAESAQPAPGILIVGTPRREAETERFRLADGRIAEYWRSSDVQDGTGSLPPLPLPPWLGAKQAGLARFAFPPGAALDDLVTPEPHLILAETGTLTVSLDGQAWFARMADGAWGLTAPAEQTLTFRPRDALLVPVGVHHTIRNGSTGGASMLGLLLYSAIDLTTKPWLSKTAPTKLEVIYSGSPISQREEWNGHASIELLARAFDIGAARGTPTLTITWLSLEPGQTLLPHPVGGVELLAAEAGSVLAGRARHDIDTGTDGQSSTEAEASVVTAGAAVAFPTGLSAPVVNGGTEPARLLLVAVEPPKPDTQASPTANLASRSGLARSQPSDAEDVVR